MVITWLEAHIGCVWKLLRIILFFTVMGIGLVYGCFGLSNVDASFFGRIKPGLVWFMYTRCCWKFYEGKDVVVKSHVYTGGWRNVGIVPCYAMGT